MGKRYHLFTGRLELACCSPLGGIHGRAVATEGIWMYLLGIILISFMTRALTCYYFSSWCLSSGWLPCYKERDERKE